MARTHHGSLKTLVASLLIYLLGAGPALAGISVTRSNGIATTGADGVVFSNTQGIATTGADGVLAFGVNGIATTGADGIATTGADGGAIFTGTSGIATTGADGVTIDAADGIATTGADGVKVKGADGKNYHVDSVQISEASGIATTGADGIATTGADGIATTGADSFTVRRADGLTIKGPDTLHIANAAAIVLVTPDGHSFSITPTSVSLTGVDAALFTEVNGLTVTGATGIATTGADGIATTGADTGPGLQSVDPELAVQLDRMTDDSNVNAIVVYHRLPTERDLSDLQSLGILGGTRYRALPAVAVTATRAQLIAVSRLAAVRSIYGNRTLQPNTTPHEVTGVERARADADLRTRLSGLQVTGRGVTVAVLDTGVDGLHADLAGRIAQNVKLAETHSLSAGFTYPVNAENLPNTDQLHGHGTFVAGVIAGSGARSQGEYRGVAPEARVVGLSAGDFNLLHVLAGFDYLLENAARLNIRVVNCSFSANTVFDLNDPVNVATRMLTERNVSVVFSAGNSGAGLGTLNPYAVAPWVVSVGATDNNQRLAAFSSRGDFASALFRPTLVAPGVSLISLRTSSAPSLTGALGVESGADAERISPERLPYYTTSSGTSFSAPQVAGTIALMLEVNPGLTPAAIRDILQRSATPLPPYYQHEVGAGMLNAHAALLEAAFARRMGQFRATLDRGQVRFLKDPLSQFTGTVMPGDTSHINLTVPEGALYVSAQIAWGPLTNGNDLKLALDDPAGRRRAEANALNLPGLTGRRERVAVATPVAGSWRLGVSNTLGPAGTMQQFTGVLDVARVEYTPLADVDNLSAATRDAIRYTLRTYVMTARGKWFRPGAAVSRAELAAALVHGARVPQYLPASASYTDVRDASTMIYVESVQAAPGGPLFHDAATGGRFSPQAAATRLAAAVALVRAAGLRSQAEARAGAPLAFLDANTIPAELRGYVALAVERGLLTGGTSFQPHAALTRAELAQAMVKLAVE